MTHGVTGVAPMDMRLAPTHRYVGASLPAVDQTAVVLGLAVSLAGITSGTQDSEWSCLVAVADWCDVVCGESAVAGCEWVCRSAVSGAVVTVCVAVCVYCVFAPVAFGPGESDFGWCCCVFVSCAGLLVFGAAWGVLDLGAAEFFAWE